MILDIIFQKHHILICRLGQNRLSLNLSLSYSPAGGGGGQWRPRRKVVEAEEEKDGEEMMMRVFWDVWGV